MRQCRDAEHQRLRTRPALPEVRSQSRRGVPVSGAEESPAPRPRRSSGGWSPPVPPGRGSRLLGSGSEIVTRAPVTVRLDPVERLRLDALARERGTTRAELLRSLVRAAVEPEATAMVGADVVRFSIPLISEDDPDRDGAAIRILTALQGECPSCGVRGVLGQETLEEAAPRTVAVKVASSSSVSASSAILGQGATVSVTREGGSTTQRVSAVVRYVHEPHCSGRSSNHDKTA